MNASGGVTASIAVAALAVTAFVYFRSPPPAHVPAATKQAPAEDRAEVVTSQLDLLQRELAALKAREKTQQSALAAQQAQMPVEARSESTAESAVDDMRAVRAADVERHREHMSDIAQAFAGERIDNVWALRTTSRINAAFEERAALRQLDHNVECRAQTCRVSVPDDGSNSVSARLPALALSVVDVLPSISAEHVDQGNGRSTVVLYMSAQDPSSAAVGTGRTRP